MHPQEVRNQRFNTIVNLLDGAFFGMGLGFASWATIMPLFIAQMTDSAMMIGLMSAVHILGWQLPQLLTANHVARLPRFKPTVVRNTLQERIPYLGLALIAFNLPTLGAKWGLALTFLMIAWQGLGAGFTGNPWQNMIGRVIPHDYLATFLGAQSSAMNLFSAASAIAAGVILERFAAPQNFAILFLACFASLVLSFAGIASTRESPRENVISKADQAPLWGSILRILRVDRNFVWFLISRAFVAFGTMAFGFYTVYAVKRLGASEVTVGVLTSVLMFSQVFSNILLGRLADRWSRMRVLELGAGATAISALLAWFAPNVFWLYPAMLLAALANAALWTVVMAVTLEFGEIADRPTYIGMASTLVAPASVVAPLLGGRLADLWGYPAAFAFAAAAALLALFSFHFMVRDPRRKGQPPAAQAAD